MSTKTGTQLGLKTLLLAQGFCCSCLCFMQKKTNQIGLLKALLLAQGFCCSCLCFMQKKTNQIGLLVTGPVDSTLNFNSLTWCCVFYDCFHSVEANILFVYGFIPKGTIIIFVALSWSVLKLLWNIFNYTFETFVWTTPVRERQIKIV